MSSDETLAAAHRPANNFVVFVVGYTEAATSFANAASANAATPTESRKRKA